jgi:hypothetical protein
MKRRFPWLACLTFALVPLVGCSDLALTTPAAPLDVYLAEPMYARMFPLKAEDYRLERIDDQAGMPEFGFVYEGYRAIYRKGNKRFEVLIYLDVGPEVMQQLDQGIRTAAPKTGSDLTRFRRNNGSYTYSTAANVNYRFVERNDALVVFRHDERVSALRAVWAYLREARLPGEPDRMNDSETNPSDDANEAVLIEQ